MPVIDNRGLWMARLHLEAVQCKQRPIKPPFGFQLNLNILVHPEAQGLRMIPQIKARVGERP